MADDLSAINELHWLIDMVQTIEVGLVVLDRDYNIQLWNGFMENHSGVSPNSIKGKNVFEQFEGLPEKWLKHKMESVFQLNNRAFISWEQRPFVFQFKNYRPITGRADFMYQNVTILPLSSLNGEVTHLSMIVYDVTDVAVNKLQLKAANESLEVLSQVDGLTQLFNRRHWQLCMQNEFDRNSRYGHDTTLVMLDIDNFKIINDTYGHQAGDKVIQNVSYLINRSLRDTDHAGRYGGKNLVSCWQIRPQPMRYFLQNVCVKKWNNQKQYLKGKPLKLRSALAFVIFSPQSQVAKSGYLWLIKHFTKPKNRVEIAVLFTRTKGVLKPAYRR